MSARHVLSQLVVSSLVLVLSCGCDQQEEQSTAPATTLEIEPEAGGGASSRARPPERTERARADTSAKTRVIVLSDKRCTERGCRTEQVLKKLGATLSGLEVVRHDWSDDECKSLFDAEGLEHLPAYLFEPSVEKNSGYRKIARYLVKTPRGKLRVLKVPATFDPRAEICDNETDDTGNGLVDCADPTCSSTVVCREEVPRRLDLFVMSMCPYGTMAMDSMSDVLDAFGRQIDFHIHYIASESAQGFRSLHGQAEVDEDIRELCAISLSAKGYDYMDYIWCRNRSIRDGNWQKCAGSKGITAAAIEKCSTGAEGQQLLRENMKLAKQLGVTASPTWLANNRFIFHGIAPEVVRKNVCAHNEGLRGCDKRLSTKTPRPAGTCE